MRRKHLTKQIEDVVKTTKVDFKGLNIIHKPFNFKISTYHPLHKVLEQKSEDRIHFDNDINIIYQSTPYLLTFRVTYTAGEEVNIQFLKTTRCERRIIAYFELRNKLKQIYKEFLNNNIDFWEVFAKIYIK